MKYDEDGGVRMNKSSPGATGTEDVPIRDRLIAAMYEAASKPDAYALFVQTLAEYLETTAKRAWTQPGCSEAEIGIIEADSGLAMHFAKLNESLSNSPDRRPPGSLRDRISSRRGLALLIDPEGHIASCSSAAREQLVDARSYREDVARRLFAGDARRLCEAISDHVGKGISVAPIVLRGDDLHIVVRTLRCDADAKEYMCIETLSVAWTEGLEDILRASFGLSPAELRVARFLAEGLTARLISQRLERSEGTVRNQIKSILAKTETRGLASLNRIVALISETIEGAPASVSKRDGDRIELEILRLPDGRSLEVRRQGPLDGRPVLFLHGMLFGSELPRSALDLLYRQNLKLIAPARPSFGMSDPPPGIPEDEADRLVQDLVFILDRYGIDRTVCLTNIAGAIYGYALAAAAPGRISGLVNVASTVPLLKARQLVSMPPTQRLIAFLMRFMPTYLPPLLKSGVAQIRASGELPFLATLYAPGTPDHAVTVRTDLSDLMKRSVHFSTDQGYLGAYTDTLHILRDWSGVVARTNAMGIPSVHLHGSCDPQYSIDDLAEFLRRFESVELRMVEGAGQLLLFDRPEPVFDAVAELL